MDHVVQQCPFMVKGIQAVLHDKKKLSTFVQSEQGDHQGQQSRGFQGRSNLYDKFYSLADLLGTEGPSVSFSCCRYYG